MLMAIVMVVIVMVTMIVMMMIVMVVMVMMVTMVSFVNQLQPVVLSRTKMKWSMFSLLQTVLLIY